VASNIITKTGSWYSFGEERIGQGKDNARMFLKENKDIRDKIESNVRAHYGLPMPKTGATAPSVGGAKPAAAPAGGVKPTTPSVGGAKPTAAAAAQKTAGKPEGDQ
jgi:hypothetical protein